MTNDRRRVDLVMRVFKELVAAGAKGVSPGAINTRLREVAEPMGAWEVRGALTTLEADGEIVIDEGTGNWFLTDESAKTQSLRDTA